MGNKLKQFALDLISLNTPQAIFIVLFSITTYLIFLPTDKLTYFPFRSINKKILPLIFGNCPIEGLFAGCCPSCGLTTATSLTFHGKFAEAWTANPLIFLVLTVVIILLITNGYKSYKYTKKTGRIYPFDKE